MNQDTATRGVAPNRHHRGRYRRNFRAREAFRQANIENRTVNTADQSNSHSVDDFASQGQNSVTHVHGQQRGTANFRGRASRGHSRGSGKSHINRNSRGRDHDYGGMHTNAANTNFHQAQTSLSMSTNTPPYDQSLVQKPRQTLSPIANLSTYSLGGHHHPGLFQIHRGNISPVAAEIPLEHFEKMSLTSGPNRSQHESSGSNLLHERLPVPQKSDDLAQNPHSFCQTTDVDIANQELIQLASGMPTDTGTSSNEPPSVSTSEGMGFKTGQSLQSSPLSYLCAHNTLQGLPDLQSFTSTPSVSIYSMISSPFGSMYVSVLDGLSVPRRDLEEHGYRTKDLTRQELEDKQRCFGCGKFWIKVRKNQEYQRMMTRKFKAPKKVLGPQNEKQSHLLESKDTVQSLDVVNAQEVKLKGNEAAKSGEAKPILHCRFHSGTLIKAYDQTPRSQVSKPGQSPRQRKFWSCCNKPPSAEPCSGNEYHQLREVDAKTLSSQWQLYPTPSFMSTNTVSHRVAVALDCEMGVSKAGDPELIRVTLIDYFTTETLIDKLVLPEVPMSHLNTQYSGVTWDMLNSAAAKRQCFRGRSAALEEVWKFVGPETIVVAHSGHNDLSSLRWRHCKIVDTYLIDAIPERDRLRELKKLEDQKKAAEQNKKQKPDHVEKETNKTAGSSHQDLNDKEILNRADNPGNAKAEDNQDNSKEVKGKSSFSLKALAKSRLGRDIQVGKNGHDSLEDALAARDLAHWHVRRIIEGISTGNGEDNVAGQTSAESMTPGI